jgi:hypothetical protein
MRRARPAAGARVCAGVGAAAAGVAGAGAAVPGGPDGAGAGAAGAGAGAGSPAAGAGSPPGVGGAGAGPGSAGAGVEVGGSRGVGSGEGVVLVGGGSAGAGLGVVWTVVTWDAFGSPWASGPEALSATATMPAAQSAAAMRARLVRCLVASVLTFIRWFLVWRSTVDGIGSRCRVRRQTPGLPAKLPERDEGTMSLGGLRHLAMLAGRRHRPRPG